MLDKLIVKMFWSTIEFWMSSLIAINDLKIYNLVSRMSPKKRLLDSVRSWVTN